MVLFCFVFLYFCIRSVLSYVLFLLPNDRAQVFPAEIGTTIEQTPVTNKITEVVVAPIITTVSTDSNIEVFQIQRNYQRFLQIPKFFLDFSKRFMPFLLKH